MVAHRAPPGYRPPIPLVIALGLLTFGCSKDASNGGGILKPPPTPPQLTGPRIAFDSNRGGSIGIHLYDPATGIVVRLSPADAYDARPAISPDGTRIAFEHYGPGGRFRIMTMAVDGSDRRDCTNDSTVSDAGPHWSPDSQYLVFTRTDRASGSRDIYAVRRDALMLVRITSDGASRVLDWSADGTRLLIVRQSVSGSYTFQDAQTFDTTTRAAASLFGQTLRNYVGGEFSPDGKRIVFSVELSQPAPNCYLLGTDAVGSYQRSMLLDADFSAIGHPSWSPDGTTIAFSGDPEDLFTVTWRFENLQSVLTGSPIDQDPDWGPKP
jgi:Tol biopolymer transport system component